MVEAIEVGKSFEGLAIRGWKAHVTVNDGGSHVHRGRRGPKGKKGQVRDKIEGTDVLEFVVQSGQHAREVS